MEKDVPSARGVSKETLDAMGSPGVVSRME
jgi:hypothetical protein